VLASSTKQNSAAQNATVEVRDWSLYRAWDNTAPEGMSRIPPKYPPPGSSEVGDKIRARRGDRGLTPLDGALLNAPEMAVGGDGRDYIVESELTFRYYVERLEHACGRSTQQEQFAR
jgi:hypothetical protein